MTLRTALEAYVNLLRDEDCKRTWTKKHKANPDPAELIIADELAALLAAPEAQLVTPENWNDKKWYPSKDQEYLVAAPEEGEGFCSNCGKTTAEHGLCFDGTPICATAPTPRQSVRYCGHEVEVGKACPECHPVEQDEWPRCCQEAHDIGFQMGQIAARKDAEARQSEPEGFQPRCSNCNGILELPTDICPHCKYVFLQVAPRQSEPEGLREALSNLWREVKASGSDEKISSETCLEVETVLASSAPSATEKGQGLSVIIEKLREQAHEAESPYWDKTPEQPDWDYVAKAFRDIADELTALGKIKKPHARTT